MKIINNLTFKAILKTKGRKTGKEHTVWAKAVTYNDMIYFSRRNPNSDWLKNAIAHPQVKVEFDGNKFSGVARLVQEEELSQKISNLKYTEESRQKEARVVLEIKLLKSNLKGIFDEAKISKLSIGKEYTIPSGPLKGQTGTVLDVLKNKLRLELPSLGLFVTLSRATT